MAKDDVKKWLASAFLAMHGKRKREDYRVASV